MELLGSVLLPPEMYLKLGTSLDKGALEAVKEILKLPPVTKVINNSPSRLHE